MGGRGEGNWDGVTMPLLMRMALESGNTLQDVKKIFTENELYVLENHWINEWKKMSKKNSNEKIILTENEMYAF